MKEVRERLPTVTAADEEAAGGPGRDLTCEWGGVGGMGAVEGAYMRGREEMRRAARMAGARGLRQYHHLWSHCPTVSIYWRIAVDLLGGRR